MIRIQMLLAWLFGFVFGTFALIAVSIIDLIVSLFDLPQLVWEVVEEKYQESE